MTDRPYVVVDPAVRFGRPQIRGVCTESTAELVAAGETVTAVADEFAMTRHEVLLACWHEATYGRCSKRWRGWAEAAFPVLAGWSGAGGIGSVPDPPPLTEQDRTAPPGQPAPPA
jgi:uncharacterized protein (DUF433 family)